MNRAAFFEAADQLSGWISNLSGTTESMLVQAEDELCRKTEPLPGDLPAKAISGMLLGDIEDRIEEVMYAFDQLRQATGRSPRYELALRLLEAPRLVHWQLRQRLDGLPGGFHALCPPDPSAPSADSE
jgi:hypothetical protein